MNDKRLQELKHKKLQQQIKYLRTELKETSLIFESALKDFDSEFNKYFEKKENPPPKGNTVKNKEPEFNIPRSDVNKIFKRISLKTHPDKLAHTIKTEKEKSKLVELYKESVNAVENKDWAKVVDIADELDIELNLSEINTEYLEESINSLTTKINNIKNTYAWIWYNTVDEDRENVKNQILLTFNIK